MTHCCRIWTELQTWQVWFLPIVSLWGPHISLSGHCSLNMISWSCELLWGLLIVSRVFSNDRWIGFEPITTASLTKLMLLKPLAGFVFQRSIQIELPSVIENVGFEPRLCVPGAACLLITPHSHQSSPNGNRTRASGATVRCTCRYTMKLCVCAGYRIPAFAWQEDCLRATFCGPRPVFYSLY